MPTFDISAHPLLSPEAQLLVTGNRPVFDAQVDAAEIAITQVAGTDWGAVTVGQAELAKLCLTHQVNHQLARDTDADVIKRQEEGDRTREFRTDIALVPAHVATLASGLPAVSASAPLVLEQSPSVAAPSSVYWG